MAGGADWSLASRVPLGSLKIWRFFQPDAATAHNLHVPQRYYCDGLRRQAKAFVVFDLPGYQPSRSVSSHPSTA
jgi:hypothetical protein